MNKAFVVCVMSASGRKKIGYLANGMAIPEARRQAAIVAPNLKELYTIIDNAAEAKLYYSHYHGKGAAVQFDHYSNHKTYGIGFVVGEKIKEGHKARYKFVVEEISL